ncbi:MAG TPA: hypothetical protein VK639_16570 [Terriglobales bacterium]|nr:hypothetical protein [Terriglobales bacterium]
MENDDDFIQQNESVLLSHPVIAAETQKMGGQWKLEEITARFSRKRDIDFHFLLVNGAGETLLGSAKIDRESCKVSKVQLGER